MTESNVEKIKTENERLKDKVVNANKVINEQKVEIEELKRKLKAVSEEVEEKMNRVKDKISLLEEENRLLKKRPIGYPPQGTRGKERK